MVHEDHCHLVEMSTFAGHSGEMSHSPAHYTSNQTPFRGIENLPPTPHFQCAAHTTKLNCYNQGNLLKERNKRQNKRKEDKKRKT